MTLCIGSYSPLLQCVYSIVSFELNQTQSLHTFVCVSAHKQLQTWRGIYFKSFHLSLSVKLILINTTRLKRLMEISSNFAQMFNWTQEWINTGSQRLKVTEHIVNHNQLEENFA